jgi:aconitate hydratase
LKDIWPTDAEIQSFIQKHVTRALFETRYAEVFKGDANWQAVQVPDGETYAWDEASTYVQNPPYFDGMSPRKGTIADIKGARIMALLGDKITTDHISPAGSIKAASPAGAYLLGNGVAAVDFNQYGTRRGNHEVMMRGTFANIRIRNFMLGENGREGGYTIHYPSKEEMPIYDAAMQYKAENVPLVVFAGLEYGNGSSRDWAAKGTNLLGVKAVIAQSYERIHRSNLVGMGVIPFVFEDGVTWKTLGLKGDETVEIVDLADIKPRQKTHVAITDATGQTRHVPVICRIDTLDELEYMKNGGILQTVLRDLAA